ncbi:MAG: acyltransferase [Alistipes sp.]
MIPIEELLQPISDAQFEAAALETFRFQAAECEPYRHYIEFIGCKVDTVQCTAQIPYLPIELFKECDIYCGGRKPEIVFTSSNTGGTRASRHPMRELALYEAAFHAAFRAFYGEPSHWSLYGLLPNYLEREGSSLVYMVDRLLADCGSGGFYLHDYESLIATMEADPKPKILLGVSYALWELAECHAPKLHKTIVMETGGMKGHREELPKAEFHRILCNAFGVEKIHSEYGMAELTSQAYSAGDGIFRTPAWMRVVTRDINDPFALHGAGVRGGINIIDLANRYSCAFIQTQDVGRTSADGSFEIEGRIDHSDIRGCNLLVQ